MSKVAKTKNRPKPKWHKCNVCGEKFYSSQALGSHKFWRHQYRNKDGEPRLQFSGAPKGKDGKRKVPAGIAKMVRGEETLPISILIEGNRVTKLRGR